MIRCLAEPSCGPLRVSAVLCHEKDNKTKMARPRVSAAACGGRGGGGGGGDNYRSAGRALIACSVSQQVRDFM